MQTVFTTDELKNALAGRRSCVTIGVFDGLHLGHQALVQETVDATKLRGDVAVAITFKSHPLAVLAPPYTPRRLVTAARKADLLGRAGIEIVAMLDFTPEFASMTPDEFIQRVLVDQANVHTVVCGYDFTFGAQGAGNVNMLREAGIAADFQVRSVQPVQHEGIPVKSTHVRDLLSNGKVAGAAVMLTRPHEVPGRVGPGMQRGRKIGFPTANLREPQNYQLPARGVYLCAARIGQEDDVRPAMVNIGVSPTFGENAQSVEAHLLNFSGELYGQEMSLYFLARLREEQQFSGVEELVAQLNRDREATQSLWESEPTRHPVDKIPDPIDHELP